MNKADMIDRVSSSAGVEKQQVEGVLDAAHGGTADRQVGPGPGGVRVVLAQYRLPHRQRLREANPRPFPPPEPPYAGGETSRPHGDTKGHQTALAESSSEQTSSALPIYLLLAKGTSMSEQKTSFMMELDKWSEENVIFPLSLAVTNGNDESQAAAKEAVGRRTSP